MPVGTAVSAPSRPISPVRGLRKSSPLNPLTRPTSPFKSNTTNNKIHLSNLERLLQRHSHPPPHPLLPTTTTTNNNSNNGLLNALNLGGLFQPFKSTAEELMSPRSLTHLQRLLSFDSPRPSPRNSIASLWRELHGSRHWAGLLDPLDENLRRELVRYGDLVQAAYHAFHSNPALSPNRPRHVTLPDRSYRVTRNLFATSSIQPPRWVSGVAPWMTYRSSWIGYVAVCENEREIKRMGRRDIVIALRGTATCLEWAENFRAGLVPIDDDDSTKNKNPPKVECGFWNLYKTAGSEVPSLSSSVVEEVRRLMEQYKGEELSITVTGHSLGAALAVLVGDELSQCAEKTPPVAVVSFGGPRVGNRGFADRVERRGVKVLRVVNAHDMVTRVPLAAPVVEGYADVGEELRVDSRVSPYLRRNADPACCHDLEAYLHLVDGFLGTHCPFRANAKRSLARLLSQQGPNVKKLYMAKAQAVKVDRRDSEGMVNFGTCLPSPS